MDSSEWVTESNDALILRLARAPEDEDVLVGEEVQAVEPFSPTFTYPIFGEQEKIYGYKGLEIKLSFASGSLKQCLEVSYDEKIDSGAVDIEAKLYDFIPPDYTKSPEAFEASVDTDAETFRPLGEKISSFVRRAEAPAPVGKGKGKGKAAVNGSASVSEALAEDSDHAVVYEVYKTTWSTPGFREYHRRMQLFILLYIEGGSYVHEDEDAWEFYTLFEKRKRPDSDLQTYHFIGYTSVYPFWCYPDQVRLRLSQFVILLPFQGKGHGSQLYSILYQHVLGRTEVAELTVEDPAEAFEDLRDRNDLRMLVKQGVERDATFAKGLLPDGRQDRFVMQGQMKTKWKIAQRQFDRLMEMLRLKQLDRRNPAQVKAYRLHVKARLYRFNYEMLCQMTPEERKEALAKTYESVVDDYDRILQMTFH